MVTEDVIKEMFASVEAGWLNHLERKMSSDEAALFAGCSCLIAYITDGSLIVGNVGDSRAILGKRNAANQIVPEQLSKDHNAAVAEERLKVKAEKPDDPLIIVHRWGSWQVKGTSVVTRSIGDAYLKNPKFTVASPLEPMKTVVDPISYPALSSVPSVYQRVLAGDDQFIVFGSPGLWEYLSNEDVTNIVVNNNRKGIADRLLSEAEARMEIEALKPKQKNEELRILEVSRKRYHYDMVAVVLFLDQGIVSRKRRWR